MLKAGERVGDWIIETPLGEGGMGAVYRVRSALTPRLVAALKIMKPSAEPDARARFVREAEALSALRHPAVVRVMGFSEDPTRGLLYLVMELALGETLRARLARGPMSLAEALATFVPLAQGLDHAHSAGIFHRDLKPSNVILCQDGTPRLVDFGIAAALESEPLTTTGQLGTLPYLPPEVFRGERAEPAALDVYAFGLLMHEALTGQRSFATDPGLTPAAAAASVGVRKLQASALELPESLPERLRELVRRATDPDAKARPSMREVRERLESVIERRASATAAGRLVAAAPAPAVIDDATTRVPDPTPVPTAATRSSGATPTGERGLGRRRSDRSRGRLLVAGGLLAAGLTLGLLLLARYPGEQPAAASVASPAAVPIRAKPAPARPSSRPVPSPSSASPAAAPAAREAGAPPGEAREGPPAEAALPGARDADLEAGEDAMPEQAAAAEGGPADVSGRWELLHEVDSTSYGPFAGMTLGYRLTLVQEGDRVHGRGYKYSENGVLILPSQRTPVEVEGRIEGGRVILNFTEIGQARTSRGTIRWLLGEGGAKMEGRFASDAANSSGASFARRLP